MKSRPTDLSFSLDLIDLSPLDSLMFGKGTCGYDSCGCTSGGQCGSSSCGCPPPKPPRQG